MSIAAKARKVAGRLPLGMLTVFGLSKALQLAVAVVIARTMSKDLAGAAFYLVGLVAFNQVVAGLGLDNFASYIYPRMKRAAAGRARMWPYINFALLVSVPVGALISLPIFFEDTSRSVATSAYLFGIVIVCTVTAVLRRVGRVVFLGEAQRIRGIIHESAANSAMLIVLFLLFPARSAEDVGTLIFFSFIGAGLWSWWDLRRALPARDRARPAVPRWRAARVLTLLALPSLVSQAAAQVLNRADVLILAPLSTASEVANYSAAIRITFLLQAIVELTNFIYGTRILAAGTMAPDARRRLATRILLQTGALTLAVSLPVLIFARPLLFAFGGAEYVEAAPTLQLLTLGKICTAPFGPLMTLFVVLGQNKRLAAIIMLAAVVNISIDVALVPHYGALGAAIGSLSALSLMGAGYVILFRLVLGKRTGERA